MPSRISIHCISPNKVLPLVRQAKANGFYYPVVKFVNDASPAQFVKEIEPRSKTIIRYMPPSKDDEGLQNVETWTPLHREQWATRLLNLYFGRTSAIQRASCDFYDPTNEPGAHGINVYQGYGLAYLELIKQANDKGLKLSIPALPQGTPEWNEMLALYETGLFDAMKASGHIWDEHSGVFHNQPIDLGFGQQIPGSPVVTGAGPYCFRYRYLYSILKQHNAVVPLVTSEFYDGGGYPGDPVEHVKRFKWYDQECRKDPYVLGFCGFTIDADSGWKFSSDYTPFYQSQELLTYQISQKDIVDDMTNQTVFNAVAAVGKTTGRNLIAQMPNDLVTQMAANRTAEYTGPSPLTWGLTDAEKQAVNKLLPGN